MALDGLSSGKTAEPGKTAADNQPAGGASGEPGGASSAAERPEWVPQDHWNAEAGSLNLETFGQHYGELATFKQEHDERLAAFPTKPEDVKFALPEGVTLPDGAAIDDKNPLIVEARQMVVEKKIDPAAANEFFGLYVKNQIAEQSAIQARIVEEQAKLGANHEKRIEALTTGLTAAVGKTHALALVGPGRLWTADQVHALEALQKKLTNQGAAAPAAAAHQAKPAAPKSLSDRLFPISKAG